MSGYKNNHKPYGPYEKYFKRPLDIIFSLLALIILLIPMCIISVLVKINLGEPVIFRQKRPGKNEKVFSLLKFRTMTDAKDKKGKLLPDEKRLTKFGKILRSTSLDELPELFNILKGDMSFIGPRPLLVEYLPYYTKSEKHRHDVRPGLTGLAQANGRNLVAWDKRLKLDIQYANHVSLLQDISIIFSTITIVFKRSGITDGKTQTMTTLIQERAGRNA